MERNNIIDKILLTRSDFTLRMINNNFYLEASLKVNNVESLLPLIIVKTNTLKQQFACHLKNKLGSKLFSNRVF